MKLTALLLFAWCMQVAAAGTAQTVTLSEKNVPLKKIFTLISKQTGLSVLYDELDLKKAAPVTIDVTNMPLDQVLPLLFKGQPLAYTLGNNAIVVTQQPVVAALPPPPVTVRGRITNEAGEPVVASIMMKGTNIGTISNTDGYFSLNNVDEKATLVVSGVSIETHDHRITARDLANNNVVTEGAGSNRIINLGIIIVRNKIAESEEVVVAYNKISSRSNTGAVTVVKGEQIQNLPVRSIDRALQGMVPGLQITSGSGLPGGNVSNITLRGIATGGTGIARNPLYVIDGVPLVQESYNTVIGASTANTLDPTNPLAQININDIETISVLKDASAIALYGTQASNGVILITTKKGKAGKLNMNFRHQTDISGRVKANRDVLDQEQYVGLLMESYRNLKSPQYPNDAAILADLRKRFPVIVKAPGDTSFYAAPDWFDELYSNKALTVSNDLSFSGGNDKATYYLSLGYLSQKGVLKSTGFDRASLRYNVNMHPVKWFNIGVNSSLTYSKQNYGDLSDGITDVNGFPYYVSPLLPVRKDDGNYYIYYTSGAGGATVPNPVASLDYNRNKADAYQGLGNIYGEVNFLKYFKFRSNAGIDLVVSKNSLKRDKRVGGSSAPTGLYSENDITRTIFLLNNILSYQQNINNTHSIHVLLGQEAQINKQNQIYASANGFTSGFSNDELNSGTNKTVSGARYKQTFMSYFGQANYAYRNKYFTTASIRLDGSSRFGANVPLKRSWSLGGGWLLTEERFLKNTGWLNYLKLRGSVGVAGNVTAIPLDTRFNMVSGLVFSNNPPSLGASVLLTHGNPDVRPESTITTDLGLEGRFWKERIVVTADVYRRKTSDLVTGVATPYTSGLAGIVTNIGDVENKGIELSLSFDLIKNKNFSWNINGNWSTNRSKLLRANDPESYASKFIYRVGENYEAWNLVRWAGVDPADGSPQWLDINGKITKTFSNSDRVMVGKPQPDGFGALNTAFRYRKVELNVFFYYAYGYKIYNSYLQSMINDGRTQPYSNQSVRALDRWQNPGDIAANPKRVLNNPATGSSNSTRYLVDGDYIRLKNIMLSYSPEDKIIRTLHLTNARLFIQVNNIAFWSKASDMDPDNAGRLGENAAAYPQQRSISIGMNIGL